MNQPFEIDIYDNKIKMYFSGLLIVTLISIFVLITLFILIQMSLLDYEVLFKALLYIFLFFVTMSFQLPFRPKRNLKINTEKVTFIYGKTIPSVMHEFSLSDITNVDFVNRFLYEKIVISSLDKHIVIRSSDYKKQDYEALKAWAQKYIGKRL